MKDFFQKAFKKKKQQQQGEKENGNGWTNKNGQGVKRQREEPEHGVQNGVKRRKEANGFQRQGNGITQEEKDKILEQRRGLPMAEARNR